MPKIPHQVTELPADQKIRALIEHYERECVRQGRCPSRHPEAPGAPLHNAIARVRANEKRRGYTLMPVNQSQGGTVVLEGEKE
jgi:hypothetical protein